jgi:integrase
MTWVDEFAAWVRRRGVKDSSVTCYLHQLDLFQRRYNLDLSKCDIPRLLAAVDDLHQKVKPKTYHNYVMTIKLALRYLEREDLRKQLPNPKLPNQIDSIKSKLLTPEQVKLLIKKARNLQHRLIFEILFETGCRKGELLSLQIKSVQFDQYGAILTLMGKTGARRRRVYSAVPDLRAYLNNHPQRDNGEAPLFITENGEPLSETVLNWRFRQYDKILGRHLHPHMFRHTRATEDSKMFTDREMMLQLGWTKPDMVSVYSHLSMRDVEDKDLVLHGLKKRDEILRPLVEIQRCSTCQEENAPIAMYCHKCGQVLGQEDQSLRQMQAQIDELKQGRGYSKEDVERMVEQHLANLAKR